jgi:hypothetical protein
MANPNRGWLYCTTSTSPYPSWYDLERLTSAVEALRREVHRIRLDLEIQLQSIGELQRDFDLGICE